MIADIIASDAEGQPVLAVVVLTWGGRVPDVGRAAGPPTTSAWTRKISPELVAEYAEYLKSASPSVPYGMLASMDRIYIYDFQNSGAGTVTCELDSAEVLGHYEPEFRTKRIYRDYLRSLVEAWLRDIALHWKSKVPPAADALRAIGLLDRLQGGDTRSEVALDAEVVR